MPAIAEQAAYVFHEWHKRINERDAPALGALYADDAVLESPLVPVVLDQTSGILEVMELDDTRITGHRIYWGWKGIAHISAPARQA